MKGAGTGIFFAVLAAALYAINSPVSKLLLDYLPPTLMAGFLYVGAGLGMGAVALVRKAAKTGRNETKLTRAELPFTLAMIALDIAAPVCLMFGLRTTSAANASLINNFEIVATALIALFVFKEKISARLWAGIALVTAACILLSVEGAAAFRFSPGALFVLLAAALWGLENNCTRKISSKDPMQIVLLKGIFSGLGSLAIGFCIGERISVIWSVFAALGVGLVAYGLSIFFMCMRRGCWGPPGRAPIMRSRRLSGRFYLLRSSVKCRIILISSRWRSWRQGRGSAHGISRSLGGKRNPMRALRKAETGRRRVSFRRSDAHTDKESAARPWAARRPKFFCEGVSLFWVRGTGA